MQGVLDTFRLGGRPSPYDEYCQPAKHKDREAEAERDPADRIEHIRPAVRNVPRADDAEGQCGQQIEHKQFEPVLVLSLIHILTTLITPILLKIGMRRQTPANTELSGKEAEMLPNTERY